MADIAGAMIPISLYPFNRNLCELGAQLLLLNKLELSKVALEAPKPTDRSARMGHARSEWHLSTPQNYSRRSFRRSSLSLLDLSVLLRVKDLDPISVWRPSPSPLSLHSILPASCEYGLLLLR